MPSHRYPWQRQRSAKCPPFDPICPLFEHDRPDHDLTARTADRAVLIELGRFLAGIHAILETPDKREVGSSSRPTPRRTLALSLRQRPQFPPTSGSTATTLGLRPWVPTSADCRGICNIRGGSTVYRRRRVAIPRPGHISVWAFRIRYDTALELPCGSPLHERQVSIAGWARRDPHAGVWIQRARSLEWFLPPFRYKRIRWRRSARTADHAVPVEFRRFLAVIHTIPATPPEHRLAGAAWHRHSRRPTRGYPGLERRASAHLQAPPFALKLPGRQRPLPSGLRARGSPWPQSPRRRRRSASAVPLGFGRTAAPRRPI